MADSDEDFVDDDYYYYNGDEDEDEDDGDGSWAGPFSRETYCGFRPSFLYSNPYTLPTPRFISPEEADRIGKELVEEEKREKEKANKKRLKKKRQKDRRRQQKLLEAQGEKPAHEEQTDTATKPFTSNSPTCKPANVEEDLQEDSSVSGSEDNLDLGSTFVRQAQRKMENKPKPERKERAKEPSRDRAPDQSKERPLNCPRERVLERTQERLQEIVPNRSQDRVGVPPAAATLLPNKVNVLDQYKIKESMDLANIGNNMANNERFGDSLHFYTEAIKINPREYRFLGNRSYVYERLGRYKEALGDAETALELQPHFLKGHFRKGKALKGLKRFAEAVAAFQQVLVFDVNHVEAAEEIAQCQQKVEEMRSCTRVKILSSAPLSPPAALLASSVPAHSNKVFMPRNIYNTKCDVASTAVIPAASGTSAANNPPVKPPAGATHSKLYPVWVGNITNKITEDILQSTFDVFGPIQSIRILSNRKCAFVNFTSKEAAEAALCAVQGLNIGGVILKLQLRNPEHSNLNVSGASGNHTIT